MNTIAIIRSFLNNYWKSIIVAIVILYLSTAPGSEFSSIPHFENEDKIIHFLMYFGLTSAFLWDFAKRFGIQAIHQPRVPILIIGIPTLWGGCMEIIQTYLTTSRSGDWKDELANITGAICGYIIAKLIVPFILKKHK